MRYMAYLSNLLLFACGAAVLEAPDGGEPGEFALSLSPERLFVRQGEAGEVQVTVDRNGVEGEVEVELEGLPEGVAAESLVIAEGESAGTLILQAIGNAVQGDAAVSVSGTAEARTRSADLRLLVGGAPGTLDHSFAEEGLLVTQLGFSGIGASRGVALQADGKIIGTGKNAGGEAFTYRLNSDGSLDESFGTSGAVSTSLGDESSGVVALALPDGHVVVGGWGQDLDSAGADPANYALIGYTAGGVLDDGFGSSGAVTGDLAAEVFDEYHALARDGDGRLLGAVASYGEGSGSSVLLRYDDRGNLDGTFAAQPAEGLVVDMILQDDGKAVLAGTRGGDFWLERHEAGGAPDTGFGDDGTAVTDFGVYDVAYGVVEVAGGKLVAAGTSEGKIALARYHQDGSPDLDFGSEGTVILDLEILTEAPGALAVDSEGRFVFVGYANVPAEVLALRPETTRRPAVVRLLADGSPDELFADGGVTVLNFGLAPAERNGVFGVALDADDRIVVTCDIGAGGGHSMGVARLWP